MRARALAAEAAIWRSSGRSTGSRQGRENPDLYADASARIMALYRRQIEAGGRTGADAERDRAQAGIERELRLVALRAERTAYAASTAAASCRTTSPSGSPATRTCSRRRLTTDSAALAGLTAAGHRP